VNEDLLSNVMAGIDPARDLTDETLENLIPHARLVSKITSGINSALPEARTVRTPVWRRAQALVGASAVALALAVTGAVSLFSSAPVTTQWSVSASSHGAHKIFIQGTEATGQQFKKTGASAVTESLVRNHRIQYKFQLDGGAFTVTPPPASMKIPANLHAIGSEMWATSQLEGYSPQRAGRTTVIGFGIVTITDHVKGIPVITKTPAWVGLAHENVTYHCPIQTGGQSAKELSMQAPSSGSAAVVIGQSFSPAEVYIAKSVRCGRLYAAELSNATEKLSLPWTMTGKLGPTKVALEVTPPPCGRIVGDAVAATWRSGSLTSVTITEFGAVPEYTTTWQSCPVPSPVRKVIDLRGLSSSSTQFIHPKTGRMTVVANTYK